MNKTVLVLAVVMSFLLVSACSPEPPTLKDAENSEDIGVDSEDSEGNEKEDDTKAPDSNDVAYFLLEEMDLDKSIGCDLNGDGKVDNAMGELLERFSGMMPGGEGEGEGENPMDGGAMVFALDGVDDFEDDDEFDLSIYGAELEDPENPPEDLYSGSGTIPLGDKQSEFQGATIEASKISTPEGTLDFVIPMGEDPMSLEMMRGQLYASIQAPDKDLLNGELTDGLMCGAIDKDVMATMISENFGGGGMGGMIEGFIKNAADIECNGKPEQCLSVGMAFTAVSVQVE